MQLEFSRQIFLKKNTYENPYSWSRHDKANSHFFAILRKRQQRNSNRLPVQIITPSSALSIKLPKVVQSAPNFSRRQHWFEFSKLPYLSENETLDDSLDKHPQLYSNLSQSNPIQIRAMCI